MEKKYQKLTPIQLIRKKPGMYIGPTAVDSWNQWVFAGDKMEYKTLNYSHALLQLFREILFNASDQAKRTKTVTEIKVSISKTEVTIYNNGKGIDVAIHPEHKVYIPTMLFSHFASSTNYGDEKRTVSGTHGIGAKATVIFSKVFKIVTVDFKRKLKFSQVYRNNLEITEPEKVVKYTESPYTLVRYTPDFTSFGMKEEDGFNEDIIAMMEKSVYDITALLSHQNVSVFLNGKQLESQNFYDYASLYLPNGSEMVYEKTKDGNWEYIIAKNPRESGGFSQVSFVNGIPTPSGGKHVKYIMDQIVAGLITIAEKRERGSKGKGKVKISDADLRNQLMLFLVCTIENPEFPNQIKETLSTNISNFGSTCTVTPKFIGEVAKLGIIENAIDLAEFKEHKKLNKTDGKKKSNIGFIDKYEPANKAGTRDSKKCTLILTEGDSAKASIMSALGKIGRDYYGVFPLKGKLLNVRDKSIQTISENEEIKNIKAILGLKNGEKYTSTDQLRYGKIMIITDADIDGAHIKGLIINFLEYFWKDLLIKTDFVTCMATPIVKVFRGKEIHEFYSLADYHAFMETVPEGNKWEVKYYKGLGTSKREEFNKYFANPRIIQYRWDDKSEESIKLAFLEANADKRKEWLKVYNPKDTIDYALSQIDYTTFVNRELKHFSEGDNVRSIPSAIDGFKPSQRKVIFAAFKRKLRNEIKVSQFAGYISEVSSYHHGEQSLAGTIINLAQDFVGSNNINLLYPSGMFGTRLAGGKDHASPRYIYTRLMDIAWDIFNEHDFPLLSYLSDDGVPIEPEYYVPTIPMALVIGPVGIGTGYSTDVPNYNPRDIIDNLLRKLRGEEMVPMIPWYKGFKGKIKKVGKDYYSYGCYKIINKKCMEITELPVKVWTNAYKVKLNEMVQSKLIKGFTQYSSDIDVRFVLEFNESLNKVFPDGRDDIFKKLKLVKKIQVTNMHLYDRNHCIKKYETPEEILNDFFEVRLEYYVKRRKYMLDEMVEKLKYLDARIKFITIVVEEELIINKRKRTEIESDLDEIHKLPRKDGNYNYLLSMAVDSLTAEKIEELTKKFQNLDSERKELEVKSPEQLWENDLMKLRIE